MDNDIIYAPPVPPPSDNVVDTTFVPDPSAPTQPQRMSQNGDLDENQASQLVSQGYTRGMTVAMSDCIASFPLRIWVVDNSGSMANPDGSRLVQMPNGYDYRAVSCTRWKEIQDTMEYHIQLAGLLKAPTVFRLLNNPGVSAGPQIFGVADKGADFIPSDIRAARKTMTKASPSGVTPLSDHIYEIRRLVFNMAPQLDAQGCKVSIVLATDGLPTDTSGRGGREEINTFLEALKSLEGLPVWIVVRLCTDDSDVVEFYNDLDSQLELSVEVLDNYTSEAAEIHKKNPWLNYTLPLHRMREMGFQNRMFDLLDERALLSGELKDFCAILFGADKLDGVPEPEVDFNGFLNSINSMMKGEKNSWHPVTKRATPLLDIKKMRVLYGRETGGWCAIM